MSSTLARNLARSLRYDWPLHLVLLLTGWLPDNVAFLRLRGWLARPFFGRCGRDLRLGRDLTLYDCRNLFLGSHVYLAKGCYLGCHARIEIGDEVMFGPYCVAVSGNHTRKGGSFRYGPLELSPITVGKGAWVGAHSVLAAAARVGEGSLVGAGSVVTGEIPAGCLAVGAPARVAKRLDDA